MRGLGSWFPGDGGTGGVARGCGCEPAFEDDRLIVDADGCDFRGRLADSEACRTAVLGALASRDADTVLVRTAGLERVYAGRAAAVLLAAGRFIDRIECHDERLAARAVHDPLGAAREAAGRAGPVADVAAGTDLFELVLDAGGYDRLLDAFEGPAVSRWRVSTATPRGRRRETRRLDTGATVRIYRRSGLDRYQLQPVSQEFGPAALATLDAAATRLSGSSPEEGDRAPSRAVAAVADETSPVEPLRRVLRKHTRGYGLLEDLFADPAVSDAFVTAPAAANPLRVTVDGEPMATNVRLADRGTAALASRFRYESGRAFSRADPTLDATAVIADREVRVAGLEAPISEGTAFAFRARDRQEWTLPVLVGNGTLTPAAGALLSLAVEEGRSLLIAGPRGAGKTTMLAALLRELPVTVRTVVIEDTPELPVGALQAAGRDVQGLQTGEAGTAVSPAEALRTALRLGDGALVVGEVRGEEAQVLYEAMRVGAQSEAVLGTIHGAGAASVFERVVSDLGVPASAFGATDIVVTLEHASGDDRRIRRIEEVVPGDSPEFVSLYARSDGALRATGRIARGNSRLVTRMADGGDSYSGVRTALATRAERLSEDAAGSSR
ncbi:MAG: ATPase, T2SS/T4P/T4SS family [Salinirussus sp.]